jgi:Lipocalin-like domain
MELLEIASHRVKKKLPRHVTDERREKEYMREWFGRIFVLAGLLLNFVFGCSTSGSGSLPTESSRLVGRWRQAAIATGNQSADCPATMPLPGGSTTSCSGNDVIEFNPNGTFTATFAGSSVKGSGTWRLVGNKLSLTFTAPQNVAGRSQSTMIRFGEGAKTINIDSKLGETPTTETYTRQ